MSEKTAPSCSSEDRSSLVVPLDFLTEIANTATLDALYQTIATWLPRIFPADRISIALRESEATMRVVAVSGGSITYDSQPIPIEGTKLGECLLSRRPVLVVDADRPGEKYTRTLTPGQDRYRSTAILPLTVGDECLGTLNFGCFAPNAFKQGSVNDLAQIATWIALQISRYQAVDRLTASEGRFDALIENADSLIFAKSADGRFLLANDTFCKSFGLKREEIVGKLDSEIFGEKTASQWRADERVVLSSNASMTTEQQRPHADGSLHSHITQKFPVYDPLLGERIICAISTDISDQLKTERALQESEERSNAFFNNSPHMMYIKDLAGKLTFANPEYLRFYGQTKQETLGKLTTRNGDAAERARLKAIDDDVLENGKMHRFELKLRHNRGTDHNLFVTKFPLHDADGKIAGIGGVNTDITEVYQQRKELRIARDEAEMAANMYKEAADRARIADTAKSEFLASMSHELRTPLNGALVMTSLLLDTELEDDQLKMVETIRTSSQSLLMILNDILDLAKIESQELQAEFEDFSLPVLMAGIEDLWRPQADAKSLTWKCDVDCKVAPVLLSDGARLRQIIFNLVSNALKFTETGGISISVAQTAGNHGLIETSFEISDTGPGIAPNLEDKLFKKFTQADSSLSRRYDGAGLGLAICHSLVELLGGEIGYESAPDSGTTFRFTIVAPPGSDNRLRDSGAAVDEPVAAAKALHVLVAEDNAVNQQVVELLLLRAGHKCTFAGNGQEAVTAVQTSDFDIVLMDIQMPEMDGVSATREIRALGGKFQTLPIVALTANAMKGDRERYLEAGMDDYVPKPIDPAELGAALFRQTAVAHTLPNTPIVASDPESRDLSDELDTLFKDFDSID